MYSHYLKYRGHRIKKKMYPHHLEYRWHRIQIKNALSLFRIQGAQDSNKKCTLII
jgi:hypothetical protein